MGTYSVSEVEKLTGIKAHTLRIWERRYQFLSANRTKTNIRAYTEDQLKQLLNVSILNRNGYKLSKLDKMSNKQMLDLVIEILDAPIGAKEDEIQGLLIGMVELDELKVTKILENSIRQNGLLETVSELIFPFMAYVGSMWRTDRTVPANEHFVSNLIRRKLISAIDTLSPAPEGAKSILLFLPEGEDHEMGLLLAEYFAKDIGWKTYYLGSNVPSDNIKDIIDQLTPDVMFSMLITPRANDKDEVLVATLSEYEIPWVCAGNSAVAAGMTSKIKYLNHPNDLIDYLNELG